MMLSRSVAVAAAILWALPAAAQDGTANISNAVVSVDAGIAKLDLPNIRFISLTDFGALRTTGRFSDGSDIHEETGYSIGASLSFPVGATNTLTLSGFWSEIDDKDRTECRSVAFVQNCAMSSIVDGPGLSRVIGAAANDVLTTVTDREVDHWGAAAELAFPLPAVISGVTRAENEKYFAVGADVRGIDQDLSLRNTALSNPAALFTYDEDLSTRYYGGYVVIGGDTSSLLFRNLFERMGLQSSFRLRGGVYYADTDYSGSTRDSQFPNFINADLSLSRSELAFIGGVTLETRKQLGARSTLSLKSDYEFYSYVPDMLYNNNDAGNTVGDQVGTVIDRERAYSIRTSLRLSIGLGSRELYKPAAYK